MSKNQLSHNFYRTLLFWVGITATFSYRIIIILNNYSSAWVEIAWYAGTIGFIWFFAHRYRVENKRDKLVEDKMENVNRIILDKLIGASESQLSLRLREKCADFDGPDEDLIDLFEEIHSCGHEANSFIKVLVDPIFTIRYLNRDK